MEARATAADSYVGVLCCERPLKWRSVQPKYLRIIALICCERPLKWRSVQQTDLAVEFFLSCERPLKWRPVQHRERASRPFYCEVGIMPRSGCAVFTAVAGLPPYRGGGNAGQPPYQGMVAITRGRVNVYGDNLQVILAFTSGQPH